MKAVKVSNFLQSSNLQPLVIFRVSAQTRAHLILEQQHSPKNKLLGDKTEVVSRNIVIRFVKSKLSVA